MKLCAGNKKIILQVLTAASLMGASQLAFANEDVYDGNNGVYVSNNSQGQVLIYPYYTIRGGKQSIINIFNTSNKTIAAKVRFHESHNSRDVLDFNIVLSPYDKWSGTISAGTTGAVFGTRDNSCTIPQIPSTGVGLNASAYNSTAFADVDADQSSDRMSEGYVEVIAMGQAEAGPVGGHIAGAVVAGAGNVAYNSTHVNGVPRNCGAVSSAFVAGPGATVYDASNPVDWSNDENADGNPAAEVEFAGLTDDFNPLRGALTIVGADGVGFGTSALAIGEWSDNGANTTRDQNSDGNHITAQQFPYFLEPTIASGNGNWDMDELFEVDAALEAKTVVNEWANNPINGAATDWIIQFPTKAFHVDIPYADKTALTGCRFNNIQASINGWRGGWDLLGAPESLDATNCNATTVPTALLEPFESRFTPTGSPVTVATVTYDKEEREGSPDGVSFSPSQPSASNALPWESNIITFGGPSVMSSSSPELSLDPVGTIPGAESNGQARMTFSGAVGLNNDGLPVIGFVAKERDQGNSALSYGQIMSHTYENTQSTTTIPLVFIP